MEQFPIKKNTLRILHFNDCYQLSRTPFFLQKISDVKTDHLILFSGDLFSPSKESQLFKGKQFHLFLEKLKIDYAIAGNHDLDFTYSHFEELIKDFPIKWVMSNLDLNNQNSSIFNKKKHFGKNEDYHVFHKNGFKVGIIGLVDQNYLDTLVEAEKFILRDPITVGRQLASFLKKQGCDIVIALTHMLSQSDLRLAKKIQEIDLFLGGHEHSYLIYKNDQSVVVKSGSNFETFNEIIIESSDKSIEETKEMQQDIVQEDESYYFIENYAKFDDFKFMKFQFSITKKNFIQNFFINKIYITDCEVKDDEYLKYCENIEKQLMDKGKEPLLFIKPSFDLRSSVIRTQEFDFGNFFSDLYYASFDCDLGSNHGGHFRSEKLLPENFIFRQRDLDELISYPDDLFLIQTTGQRLLQFYEEAYDTLPSSKGGFTVFSQNVNIHVKISQPPLKRIQKFLINGQNIQLDKQYKFIDLSFPLHGRDGFTPFQPHEMLGALEINDLSIFLNFVNLAQKNEFRQEFYTLKELNIQKSIIYQSIPDENGEDIFTEQNYQKNGIFVNKECLKRLKLYSLAEDIREIENKYVFVIGSFLGRLFITDQQINIDQYFKSIQ